MLDPVFKLNIEGEENSSRDQTVFFLQLDRLTTEAGCTVILNDHSGKGNQSDKDPLDVIRGSSAKAGDLDVAMVLRKHEVEGCFSVDMVHRELPRVEPFVLGWKYPLMELRTDLDPESMKKAKGGQSRKHDPLKLLARLIKDTTAEKPSHHFRHGRSVPESRARRCKGICLACGQRVSFPPLAREERPGSSSPIRAEKLLKNKRTEYELPIAGIGSRQFSAVLGTLPTADRREPYRFGGSSQAGV